MNKRQKKKWMKKIIEEEFSYCQGCGKKLDLKKNEYHSMKSQFRLVAPLEGEIND